MPMPEKLFLFADLASLSAAAVGGAEAQQFRTSGNHVDVDLDADLAALSAAAGDAEQ